MSEGGTTPENATPTSSLSAAEVFGGTVETGEVPQGTVAKALDLINQMPGSYFRPYSGTPERQPGREEEEASIEEAANQYIEAMMKDLLGDPDQADATLMERRAAVQQQIRDIAGTMTLDQRVIDRLRALNADQQPPAPSTGTSNK